MIIDSEVLMPESSTKGWVERTKEVNKLADDIFKLVEEVYKDQVDNEGNPKSESEEAAVNRRIIDRFGEDFLKQYGVWHAFIYSSIGQEKCIGFDTPGGEIQKAIEDEIKKLEELKKT